MVFILENAGKVRKNIELSLIKFKNRFDYSTLPTDLKKEFKI